MFGTHLQFLSEEPCNHCSLCMPIKYTLLHLFLITLVPNLTEHFPPTIVIRSSCWVHSFPSLLHKIVYEITKVANNFLIYAHIYDFCNVPQSCHCLHSQYVLFDASDLLFYVYQLQSGEIGEEIAGTTCCFWCVFHTVCLLVLL